MLIRILWAESPKFGESNSLKGTEIKKGKRNAERLDPSTSMLTWWSRRYLRPTCTSTDFHLWPLLQGATDSTDRQRTRIRYKDNDYGAVIISKPLWEINRCIWWITNRTSASGLHRHTRTAYPPVGPNMVPRRVEGWVDLRSTVRMYSPCWELYVTEPFTINS